MVLRAYKACTASSGSTLQNQHEQYSKHTIDTIKETSYSILFSRYALLNGDASDSHRDNCARAAHTCVHQARHLHGADKAVPACSHSSWYRKAVCITLPALPSGLTRGPGMHCLMQQCSKDIAKCIGVVGGRGRDRCTLSYPANGDLFATTHV